MRTIEEIRDTITTRKGAQALTMLSMRVMINTGVSLKQPTSQQNTDQTAVQRVIQTLHDMGVTL